ncbi:Asp23/Gls24 family envelope stress response protein [Nocardia yunnanensis]|uniref:Asp23/Gls24 family envelope stress response protein n=1 Tax=Nocardia yunnanensis TaxID=2382165 RepID=A0A386ZGS8_9NOCA|nr:Asp23/Gls24 family envelope stress response protein [Nocardia yunnanensis]AYF76676.1 Asp23/Gls24 family envelope stress response protein [Nocardia yunnanensis]
MTVVADPPGRLSVSERAVRRIAAQAAREVDGVEPEVSVRAQLSGDRAELAVSLPIRYPLPVARVSEDCRRHLIERASELAGVAVTGVEITVTALVLETDTAAARSTRRVR